MRPYTRVGHTNKLHINVLKYACTHTYMHAIVLLRSGLIKIETVTKKIRTHKAYISAYVSLYVIYILL